MIKQYAKGRVAVFIDAANILYSQQTLKRIGNKNGKMLKA